MCFGAFGIGPSAEHVGKSMGFADFFGPFLGPWMTTSCQQRSPCFDKLPNVSCVFAFSHAIFIF